MIIEKPSNHSFRKSLLLGGLIIAGASAHAAEVTQLIHFDDASNGASTYSDADANFLFDPTNFSSTTLCAPSTAGGNGSCVQEARGGNGPITTMTRLSGDIEGPNIGESLFDLNSFYFLLNGNGAAADNFITVTANTAASATFMQGVTYTNITTEDGIAVTGALQKGVGYFATITTFDDILSAVFSGSTDANVRLDCISATFSGSTTEPASGFSGGCGIQEVPIPAAAWLFGSGLLGLVGMSRRRKS